VNRFRLPTLSGDRELRSASQAVEFDGRSDSLIDQVMKSLVVPGLALYLALDSPSNAQLVKLSFSESEGVTTVLLVNSRISTGERRDAQDQRWHGCRDQLDWLLTS
jgi:hypothetical protein